MKIDNRKVMVYYPDKTIREYTVQRLRMLFRSQDETFVNNFFYNLVTYGHCNTGTAEYRLIKTLEDE